LNYFWGVFLFFFFFYSSPPPANMMALIPMEAEMRSKTKGDLF